MAAGGRALPAARRIVAALLGGALLAAGPRVAAARGCGDGVPAAGEECDQGKQNGSTCCDTSCRWRPEKSLCIPVNGTPCRQGFCDQGHICIIPEAGLVDPCTRTATCRGCEVKGTGSDGFSCTGPTSADGTQCADDTGPSHRCTLDVCKAGECVHPEKECPPPSEKCMTSACDPATGSCETRPVPNCRDGKPR